MLAGRADEATSLGLGWQWDGSHVWRIGERGRLSVHYGVLLARWRADRDSGRDVTQIGVTPALRYWPGGTAGGWFFEGGIGANLLTPLYRTHDSRFSTALNFGDHLALGYRWALRSWAWSLRIQHFSNGGLKHPNPGENFVQLQVALPLGSAR